MKKQKAEMAMEMPGMDDHQMNSDIDTLHKAHKIKKDKKHMKKLRAHCSEKMESFGKEEKEEGEISSTNDIREKSNKKAMEKYEWTGTT